MSDIQYRMTNKGRKKKTESQEYTLKVLFWYFSAIVLGQK